jgi:hypothetical protein
LRPRCGIRVQVVAALAAVAALAVPAAAQAQGGAVLDGAPLNVFADGLGAIQVRQDGVAAGLFYDPDENPAHAGLEIKDGETYYPLEDGFATAVGRANVEPLTVVDSGGGTRLMSTAYTVGPNLRVGETIRYTDGESQVHVTYSIQNVSGGPVSVRAGSLADPFVGNNDNGNGVIRTGAPRFVGGRDEATGLVYGMLEQTGWAAYQEGDFELVFDNFSADGLNNTVDSAAPDNGVGVEWRFTLAPGESRPLTVTWLLAAPAPPGTVSPPPLEGATGGPGEAEIRQLPPPEPGKTVNVSVRAGRVFVRIPPSRRFVELKDARQIPVGATIDTRRGRVNLVSAADRQGTTQLAWFYSGIFKVGQSGGSQPITNLTLAEPLARCPRGNRANAAARKKTRRLWGEGRGRFRTTGQFSSATVRGTRWLVVDRCDGTLTRVTEGSVAVRDFVRRRTVLVRAGRQYLARRTR